MQRQYTVMSPLFFCGSLRDFIISMNYRNDFIGMWTFVENKLKVHLIQFCLKFRFQILSSAPCITWKFFRIENSYVKFIIT